MAPTREERIALAEGAFDAFNDGDMQRMLDALTDDVEVYASPEMINAGEFEGHDGFVKWIRAWVDAWEELRTEVTANEAVGENHIVTSIHQEGRGRGGIEVQMDLAFLFEVNDDVLCCYLAMLPTPEEAHRIAEEREAG